MNKKSRKVFSKTISGGIIGRPGILSRVAGKNVAGKKKDQEQGLSWSFGLKRATCGLFDRAYFRSFEDHENQVNQDAEDGRKYNRRDAAREQIGELERE